MSVLICGMEMPKNCDSCLFDDGVHCMAYPQSEYLVYDISDGKPNWCPLVEVSPHGRLIDEQWLKDAMITTLEALKKNPKMDKQEMHLIAAFDTLRVMVEGAPTVIEAEGET